MLPNAPSRAESSHWWPIHRRNGTNRDKLHGKSAEVDANSAGRRTLETQTDSGQRYHMRGTVHVHGLLHEGTSH